MEESFGAESTSAEPCRASSNLPGPTGAQKPAVWSQRVGPADPSVLVLDAHIAELLRSLYGVGTQSSCTTASCQAEDQVESPTIDRRIHDMTIIEQTSPEQAASEAASEPFPASGDSARPIAVVMDFVGATLSQVDQLLRAMQLATGDAGSPGSLFLWSRSTLDGVRITEVWQSRRAFELVRAKELNDGLTAARMPQPEITVYEVHSYLTQAPSLSAQRKSVGGLEA